MERDLTLMTSTLALVRLAVFGMIVLYAALWRVFRKAGRPGWAALVPFWNGWVMIEVAGKPGWWLFLYLIPIWNIVIAYQVNAGLARRFGKGTGFAWGLFLLPFIFLPILADGPAEYRGEDGAVVEAKARNWRRGAMFASVMVIYSFWAVMGVIGSLTASATVVWGGKTLAIGLASAWAVGLAALWFWQKWGAYVALAATAALIAYGLAPQEIAPQQAGEFLIRYHVGYSAQVVQAVCATLMLAAFVWSLRRVWGELR